jgi:hypothetical protein
MEFSMPTFNVHLYREMWLFFPGIEADTPEQAAKLVAEKPTDEAEYTDDCEGATTSALVDLVGDEDYSESVTIDLDPVKAAAQELYETLTAASHALKSYQYGNASPDLAETVSKKADAILAKARGETLPKTA